MDAAHLGENPFATPAPPPAYEDRRIRASPVEQIEKDFGLAPLGPDPHSGHADGADPEKQQTKTELSKWERWLGPWVYIVPIFTATALLFAATCSADSWRVKVNVVRVDLPNDVFARLLATAKSLGKTSTGQKAEDGVEARGVRFISAGYLSVGFWGWCVSRPDQSEYVARSLFPYKVLASTLQYTLISQVCVLSYQRLVHHGRAARNGIDVSSLTCGQMRGMVADDCRTNRIPVRAFHDGLIHGQVVYGPGESLFRPALLSNTKLTPHSYGPGNDGHCSSRDPHLAKVDSEQAEYRSWHRAAWHAVCCCRSLAHCSDCSKR